MNLIFRRVVIAIILLAAIAFLLFGSWEISVHVGLSGWVLTLPMAALIAWILWVMYTIDKWDREDKRNY